MAKKNTKQVKKDNSFIKTKQKMDNSIEVTVNKSPAKTKLGIVLVWLISGLTILLPVVSLIYIIILACK